MNPVEVSELKKRHQIICGNLNANTGKYLAIYFFFIDLARFLFMDRFL